MIPVAVRPRVAVLPLLALPALAQGACGGHKLVDAYTALDGDGARKRDTFYTDSEQIWCVAAVQSGDGAATVNATIRATELDGVQGNYVLAVGEQAPQRGKSTLGFQLVLRASDGSELPDAPFVPGRYACDVSIDGQPQATVDFVVLMPSCPVYPAPDGAVCGGFYPEGIQCPGVDQSTLCTCESNGRWKC